MNSIVFNKMIINYLEPLLHKESNNQLLDDMKKRLLEDIAYHIVKFGSLELAEKYHGSICMGDYNVNPIYENPNLTMDYAIGNISKLTRYCHIGLLKELIKKDLFHPIVNSNAYT